MNLSKLKEVLGRTQAVELDGIVTNTWHHHLTDDIVAIPEAYSPDTVILNIWMDPADESNAATYQIDLDDLLSAIVSTDGDYITLGRDGKPVPPGESGTVLQFLTLNPIKLI